ncbi:MAG TPA: DMT family transporter [Roseiarcus sp.]|nr:DMT family transporter [Roseiarcus sp.]
MGDCDGVRLLPGAAGHVQRLSGPVGHRRDLGRRNLGDRVHTDVGLGCCCDLSSPASRPELGHGSRDEGRRRRHDGGVYVAGLAFVAPRLGPTQTFILYFFAIAAVSALIDNFGLLGTEAKPLQARQLVGVLTCGCRPRARPVLTRRRRGRLSSPA